LALTLAITGFDAHSQSIARDRIDLGIRGVYGYNSTQGSYGGTDVGGFLPVIKYLDATVDFEILSSKSLSVSATLTPYLTVGKGRFYIDATALYRSLYGTRTSEFDGAASLGYRRQYFSIQAGAIKRAVWDMDNPSDKIKEAVRFIYRGEFKVRPATSRWNAGGAIANYSPYEFENTWSPLFFIDGYYRITEKIRIVGEVMFKPTGMFHQVASYHGIIVRTGIHYTF